MARRKVNVNLFPKQFKAYNFPTQFALVCAGVQSGKTFLGSVWSVKKFKSSPVSTGAIIAPTYKILNQSTLDKLFNLFPTLRPAYKEQKGEIELSLTKKIFTRSADNPLGLEGMTLDWAWLDEAGMMPRLVWNVIRSRVSITGGQVLLTTTPYSMNWIYQDFYLPWKNKIDPALSFYTWKSTDNSKFSKKFFTAEKKRLRPEEFSRRYLGEFQKMEGLVYDLPPEQIISPCSLPSVARFVCGVDWGFRNPSAILIIAVTPSAIYIIDEWKETEKTTAEIIEVLKGFISRYDISLVFPDPAEPDRIKELALSGIPSQNVSKDIKGGISYVQQLIKDKKLFVFNSCENLLDEINTYHYPEAKELFTDVPVKLNDHLLDCLRYSLHSLNLNFKVAQEEKLTDEIISGNF
jgi:phage terminase large subunit